MTVAPWLFWWYLSYQSIFQKDFEGEMFDQNLSHNSPFKCFVNFHLIPEVILKNTLIADVNIQGYLLQAWLG